MPAAIKFLLRRLRRGNPLAGSVVHPGFAEKLHLTERLRAQEAEARRPFSANLQQEHAQAFNAAWGPVLGLSGYERVAGRYGVELRDPWADRRVAEFFLRLPLDYKVRDGWNKSLPRRAFAADLEDSVRWRLGKEHLGWQFTVRLMEKTDALVEPLLELGLEAAGAYVDAAALRARLKKYRINRDIEGQEFFYETLTLLLWVRRVAGG